MTEDLKITKLKINNFMKIGLVDVDVTGDVINIKGKNGAGKSTVLDAIYYTIAGGFVVDKPIKKGTKKATIEITLEGKERKLEIARIITEKSNRLTIKENGETKTRASEILKGLINKVSIDPCKFLDMEDKDKVKMLSKVCNVDYDFDAEAEATENDIRQRQSSKITLKETEIKLKNLDIPADIPADLPNLEETLKQIEDANKFNSEQENLERRLHNIQVEAGKLAEENKKLKERHAALKKESEELGEPQPLIDVEPIRENLKYAQIAGKIELKKEFEAEITKQEKTLSDIEERISGRKENQAKAIASANIPVEGLSTDGETLILNDIPFAQASTAERIKVATSLAVMANKDLKLINIKDATLMDKATMQAVAEVAKANGCQIFMEVVSEDDDVVIEFSDENVPAPAKEETVISVDDSDGKDKTVVATAEVDDGEVTVKDVKVLDDVHEEPMTEEQNEILETFAEKSAESAEQSTAETEPVEETPDEDLFDGFDDLGGLEDL